MKITDFITLILFLINFYSYCNIDEYYEESGLRYEDFAYKTTIQSAQLYRGDSQLNLPIINLGSNDYLTLRFDDLEGIYYDYYYTLIHCDSQWNPSDLMKMEFITGVTEQYITKYNYSTATLQKYIHYTANFPNNNMKITKSGNYIVKVYQDANEDQLILTKRFMVVENNITISAKAKRPANVELFSTHQEIDFTIHYDKYELTNPYTDLKVIVQQNQRWDNTKKLTPLFVKTNELVYDYDKENVFYGGNEFRVFDIKNLNYRSTNVDNIVISKENGNQVYLVNDERRTYKAYMFWPDINGKRAINVESKFDSNLDADYAHVYFKLAKTTELTQFGDIYVFGELADWNLSIKNRMKYDTKSNSYELNLYLKQGYYNYYYLFVPKSQSEEESLIEGSHWQTENTYTIYAYHRRIGDRYDRLIGVETINSNK